MSNEPQADLLALRKEVKTKYRAVAMNPKGTYHFRTGRPWARRLGYDDSPNGLWRRSRGLTLLQIRSTAGRLRYAWIILAVTFLVVVVTAGVRATPSVLIVPLEEEFHWSRATISFALGINLLLYGAIGPFAAAVMDGFGARRTMTLALVTRITVIHQIGGASAAYLAGVLRITFGTYLEAFILSGILLIVAALMVLFIGVGRNGREREAVATAAL